MLRAFREKLGEVIAGRAFDAAKSHRLNKQHWKDAKGQTANEALRDDQASLAQRTEHEDRNNPFVAGIIGTHATDLIGAHGPTLQVTTPDRGSTNYTESLEQIWNEWAANPDVTGQHSLTELLVQDVNMLWKRGEWIWQKTRSDSRFDSQSPVRLRVHPIHPRRLATPPGRAADDAVEMGVERDRKGRPVAYHVQEARFGQDTDVLKLLGQFRRLRASEVLHGFRALEPGQVRGIPWLASVLQAIADLRDYDQYVLDAAKQAAIYGIVWHTDHPDAPFWEVSGTAELEPGRESTGPAGWKPMQIQPEQPSTEYVSYRRERLRDMGRPVGMPLLTIALDSSNHNMASARFDAQVYQRTNAALQGWTERTKLDPLLRDVEREARLGGLLGERPERLQFNWTWPKPPVVDPDRETKAEEREMRNGTATLQEIAARRGMTAEALREQHRREAEQWNEAGFLTPLQRAVLEAQAKAGSEGGAATAEERSEEIRAMVEDVVNDVLEQRNGMMAAGMHTAS